MAAVREAETGAQVAREGKRSEVPTRKMAQDRDNNQHM